MSSCAQGSLVPRNLKQNFGQSSLHMNVTQRGETDNRLEEQCTVLSNMTTALVPRKSLHQRVITQQFCAV